MGRWPVARKRTSVTFGCTFCDWRNCRRSVGACSPSRLPRACMHSNATGEIAVSVTGRLLTTSAALCIRRSAYDDASGSMMSVCGAAINGMAPSPVNAAKLVSGPFNSRMGGKLD